VDLPRGKRLFFHLSTKNIVAHSSGGAGALKTGKSFIAAETQSTKHQQNK
jgi:hypothetical protein